MKIATCPREAEVVRAALRRQWPRGCDADLRQHVMTCGCCSEVAALTVVLSGQVEDDVHLARVPAAGQVWWRAAVRAHTEATRTAVRPMVWALGIAGACAAGLGVALIGFAWPALQGLAGEAGALAARAGQEGVLVALAIAACVVLTPLLVYVALSDD